MFDGHCLLGAWARLPLPLRTTALHFEVTARLPRSCPPNHGDHLHAAASPVLTPTVGHGSGHRAGAQVIVYLHPHMLALPSCPAWLHLTQVSQSCRCLGRQP